MYKFETQIRVRYAETDKMGYVYYGNFATYFEVARVEALRSIGMSYRSMEEERIIMPILDFHCKYIRPGHYDDLLTIKVLIPKIPDTRIYFKYETFNNEGILLNKAETTLVFVKLETGKPCKPPNSFQELMKPFFKEDYKE